MKKGKGECKVDKVRINECSNGICNSYMENEII